MLSFEGSGIVSEKRALKSAKSGLVWRRLINLAYMGGMAELVIEDEKLYDSVSQGKSVKVVGSMKPGLDGKAMMVATNIVEAK